VVGPCTASDGCVRSPNFPSSYGNDEACTISGAPQVPITVSSFDTEARYDWMTIMTANGAQRFEGTSGPVGVVVAAGSDIQWRSDGSIVSSGWELCFGDSPTFSPPSSFLAPSPPAPVGSSCVCGSSPTEYATFNDPLRCFGAADLTNVEVMYSGVIVSQAVIAFYTLCADYDNDGAIRANDLTNMKRYYAGLLPMASHVG